VVWTNAIPPARQQDGRHDRCDVDNLDEYKQRVVSKYAVAQEEDTGNKPN